MFGFLGMLRNDKVKRIPPLRCGMTNVAALRNDKQEPWCKTKPRPFGVAVQWIRRMLWRGSVFIAPELRASPTEPLPANSRDR
jgi:hypothetical protein